MTEQRNREIARAILDGAAIAGVAEERSISRQRVHQILLRWCRLTHPALFETRPSSRLLSWLREHKHLFYEPVADIQIDDVGMGPWARNALRRERILTLGDLAKCTPKQLRLFLNLGKVGIAEIEEVLAKHHLVLQPDPPIQRTRRGRGTSKWPPLP